MTSILFGVACSGCFAGGALFGAVYGRLRAFDAMRRAAVRLEPLRRGLLLSLVERIQGGG